MCLLLLCFAMYDTEYGWLDGRSVGFNVHTLTLFYNVSYRVLHNKPNHEYKCFFFFFENYIH